MSTDEERREAGLRIIKEIGFDQLPQVAEGDPEFAEHTTRELFGTVFTRPGLTLKQREMITIAVITAIGGTFDNLSPHLLRAPSLDITDTEIREIIIHTMYYAGWPRGANAMNIYRKLRHPEGEPE